MSGLNSKEQADLDGSVEECGWQCGSLVYVPETLTDQQQKSALTLRLREIRRGISYQTQERVL